VIALYALYGITISVFFTSSRSLKGNALINEDYENNKTDLSLNVLKAFHFFRFSTNNMLIKEEEELKEEIIQVTADHDRPLNKRGKRDAPPMGELLRNEHLIPEAIISSTAARARATAEAVAKACGYKGEITLNRSLYANGPEAYLVVLHGLSIDSVRVLMVGHNPGV
jgi:hypothetical protein